MTDTELNEKLTETNKKLMALCKTDEDFDTLSLFTQLLSDRAFREGEDYMFLHKSWRENKENGKE